MKKFLLSFVALLFVTSGVMAQTRLNTYQPGPRLIDGNQLNLMVAAVNNLQGTGTPGAVTGTTGAFSGAVTISSANAACLSVGPNGNTNPTFRVVCNTTSAATGFQVTSAAAAGGLALAVVSSGTNENLTLDAKGSGTITLGGTSTGNIVLTRATTGLSFSGTGVLTARSGTATPAAASAVPALSFGSAGVGLYWGTGTPSISAAKGSLYIQTDGSSSSTRLFVNSDGSTAWVAITTAS